MKFATKAIHAGVEPEPITGAIMTPIFQTSTYAQASPGQHTGYEYARTHNPTRQALEASLAALEEGKFARCFGSGLAAVDSILRTLKPGDEVLACNDLYGGTYRIFTKVHADYGLKFRFVSPEELEGLASHMGEATKMVWLETPTNPLLRVFDIAKAAETAHRHGAKVVVDNTFATPYLQRPLTLGADIVMHSITKYIGGHSDVIMGCVVTNEAALEERFAFLQNAVGAVPGPQDCFLALRGIKTLHLRMERHCQNAQKVAEWLETHEQVEKVVYPGLPSHEDHAIAKRQMDGFGGMISFTLKGDSIVAAKKLLETLKVFTLAESLGGVESLAESPAIMTHASIPKEEREKAGLADSLVRLSVGVEDADDLIADLEGAIAAAMAEKNYT